MTEMTSERFRAITEAYGAEPGRWPEGERAAALAFAAGHAGADAWLEAARGLDALLDLAHEPVTAEMAEDLHYRAMARFAFAPPPQAVVRPAQVMWAGLGIAACLAGAVLGVNLSLKSLSDMRAQTVLEQTAMIDGD